MTTPAPQSDPFKPLYAPLGRLVVRWAYLERVLDYFVAAVYHRCGGNTLVRELPHTLDRKIRFLRDSLNQLPSLAESKDKGTDFLNRLAALKQTRHDLVHGIVNTANPPGGIPWDAFEVVRLNTTKQLHEHVSSTLSLAAVRENADNALGLANELAAFLIVLVNSLVQKPPI